MIESRERRIIDTLLVTCIVAAFACFALIVLPDQLRKAGALPGRHGGRLSVANISSVVPIDSGIRTVRVKRSPSGSIARFDPEPAPQDPFSQMRPDGAKAARMRDDDVGAAGGAGVAIDDQSSESTVAFNGAGGDPRGGENPPPAQPQAGRNGDDGDLAVGDPYGNRAAPEDPVPTVAQNYSGAPAALFQHRSSSIARREPSAGDSERGRREKPWLIPPPGLEADVAFWRDIYTKYDRHAVVLHHPRYLDIVYDVVDLTDVDSDPRLNDIERSRWRENRIEERRRAIVESLKKLATNPPAGSLSDDEVRIKKLFANMREADAFRRAYEEDGVRAQLGQRDKFIPGLAYSGRYLGEIEAIFESYGLPRELTRIIFVESMFNPHAVSSVGASGIWQFMRSTGKLYLRINDIVDERNDPILAAHAAARLLTRNYESLGTWPLAINAYNAGRGRLEQAVAAMGTNDIGRIIKGFSHPAYGFASRNFFLEYLAAYEVAEHAERYFGRIEYDPPLRYESVRASYHISLPDVARIAMIPIEEIAELNQAFTDAVISGRKLLPAGYELRVPERKGDLFLAAAARAPRSRTGPLNHVVKDGETLPSIAAMYGVTPAAILKSNQHVGRQLSPGQALAIPDERR
ncbi:MAG: transglycosylase SLT domain-containing protein [bacterium]